MIRADGSLVETPGYDAATRHVYVPSGEFPPIDTSSGGIACAIERLRLPFAEFPFVDNASRAAAVAAVLSGLARTAFPCCPMYFVRAPLPGSGKGLLADAVSTIVTGRPGMCLSPENDEMELDRVLTGIAASGEGVAIIDNICGEFKSPTLARVVTSSNVSSRMTGTSSVPRLPWKVVLFLTGNNVTLKGELIRRTVLCDLDAHVEHPETREFAVPELLPWISERRPELVSAGLTILAGYMLAGAPPPTSAMGSFEEWNRLVRGAVVWAGIGDPLANRDALGVEQSEDDQLWFDVLRGLVLKFGKKMFVVSDALELITKNPAFADLICLWLELPPLAQCPLTPRMVGDGFRHAKNKVVQGLCLRRGGKSKGHVQWWVEEVS
jgi:putative DNA primase/helicase